MAYSDRKGYGRGRTVQWRGALPGDDTPPEHLEFAPEEYEQLPDRVKIALRTVLDKLPAPSKKKYLPVNYARQVLETQEALIAAGLERETLLAWCNEYSRITQHGRAWSAVLDTLNHIKQLLDAYSAPMVNIGLMRCLNTQKPTACTAPYLRVVLKNLGQTPQSPTQPPPAAAVTTEQPEGDPWARIVGIVRQRIDPRSFATWIRPLRPGRITAQELQVICPDEVYVGWLQDHYVKILSEAFAQVMGHHPPTLSIVAGDHP